MFTSRFAAQQQKRRGGVLHTIRSRFQRPARRRELNGAPVVVKHRGARGLSPAFLLVLVAALVVMAYGPLVRGVSDLKFFKIREITITGCRMTTPALIRELAGVRYQASLATLNPAHVEAILRAHPWIARAEVKRDWPDVLVVSIQEYAPEALIAQEFSGRRQFFYLDRSGVVFAPVEPGQDMDFPIITGLETRRDDGQGRSNAVETRDGVSGDGQEKTGGAGFRDGAGATGRGRTEMISEALALLKLVRQNNPNLPLQNLSEIHVDRDAGMTIYLVDYPFPIYFGKGEIRMKYSRLKRVLEVLYKETEQGMTIADVAYIRMDYLENKVLVAHSGSG